MNIVFRIQHLKDQLLRNTELSGLCYLWKFGNKDFNENKLYTLEKFSGHIEKVAAAGYLSISLPGSEVDRALVQIKDITIQRILSVYHIIGICLQCRLIDDYRYQVLLNQWYEQHSIRIKFLLALIFEERVQVFKGDLNRLDGDDLEYTLMKKCFNIEVKHQVNLDDLCPNPDMISLFLLTQFSQRSLYHYEKEKEQLLQAILYSVREVQSKHRVFNNNEDQFNSVIHSILSREFRVENQSQRGVSLTGKTPGELDVKVFTLKDNYPLAIIEGLVINTIDSDYISKHLDKLTVNYDPNGLSRNYAVIYAKTDKFTELWSRYLEFVSRYEYQLALSGGVVYDITNQYPTFANIKIGLANHINNELPVEVYHLFLNMKI